MILLFLIIALAVVVVSLHILFGIGALLLPWAIVIGAAWLVIHLVHIEASKEAQK